MKKLLEKIANFNQMVAEHVVGIVSTMWCAYAFTILVVLPFFNEAWTTIVMFISSSLLQLVLLPVIMVGQKRQGDISEARAIEDHANIVEIHEQIKIMFIEMKELIDSLHTKIDESK